MNELPISGDWASRRERRELNRSQREDMQGKEQRGPRARRVVMWIGGLAVLGGIAWLMVRAGSQVTPPTGGDLTVPISASDNITGPANFSITLVEYSDFQCPACALFHVILKEFLASSDAKNSVRFVYRNFPLAQHQNGELSARAAQAAGLQGKFWGMYDVLFENQSDWSGLSDSAARVMFAKYAQSLGLDVATWTRDLDSAAVKNKIQTDVDGGTRMSIDQTPTFFVNGKRMPTPENYDQFKQFILNGIPTPTNS